MNRFVSSVLPLALVLTGIGHAKADLLLSGSVYENYTNTSSTSGTIADKPGGTPAATFMTQSVNYQSQVTGYTIGAFLNNPTFLTGASHAGDSLGKTYFYLTGVATFTPGSQQLTFKHDDGAELLITQSGSTILDVSQGGGTVDNQPILPPITFNSNPYTITIAYTENNIPPGDLIFQGSFAPAAAPEPATLTMAGIGLAVLGAYKLRRRMRVVG